MENNCLSNYIAKNHSGGCFTESELNVLKYGDIRDLVATFVKMKNERYNTQLQCVLKILTKYIGSGIKLRGIDEVKKFKVCSLGCQLMEGDEDIFLGISGDERTLIKLASLFAYEEFDRLDSDVYDAVCEIINYINGMFASQLSDKDINVTLELPVFHAATCIYSEKGFYVANIAFSDMEFDVILCVGDRVRLERI